MKKTKVITVDAYLKTFPGDVQEILRKIRKTIQQFAPKADESISYMMPAYKLNGKPLVYFAAWNSHMSLYPTGNSMLDKVPGVATYRASKGTLKFDFDKPFPYALLKKIVAFRVSEVQGGASSNDKSQSDIPGNLGAPALRALKSAKVGNLSQLSKLTEKEIAGLHGMGPKGVRMLKKALKGKKLSFKKI